MWYGREPTQISNGRMQVHVCICIYIHMCYWRELTHTSHGRMQVKPGSFDGINDGIAKIYKAEVNTHTKTYATQVWRETPPLSPHTHTYPPRPPPPFKLAGHQGVHDGGDADVPWVRVAQVL